MFIGISAISIVEVIQLVIDVAMVICGKNLIGKEDDSEEADKGANENEDMNHVEMEEVHGTEDLAVNDMTTSDTEGDNPRSTSQQRHTCHT